MSNMKRNTLLILLVMLVFLAVPMSFASDVNATDLGASDAPSDVVQYSDEDVISDSNNGFCIDETNIEINEGDSATITGTVVFNDGEVEWYGDLNFKYSYIDSNGVTQSENAEYIAYDGYTITISDLTAAKSPYIVTFSIIEDDLYDDFLMYGDEIQDETVTITVIGTDAPIEDPAVPEYTTLTPAGQLYVDDSTGNDENDGSEAAPYKTIQAALDQNAALGGNYEVIVNAGTYNVAGYTILNPVRITGRGKVIIDAQQSSYQFSAAADTVEFYNLILINGKTGTTGSISGSSSGTNTGKVMNIINCTFKDNSGYIGVLRTYATTTILYSNFINNTATVSSSGFGNIIYSAANDLTVKFCNFINNNPKSGKAIIDSVNKANANYNFWGSNDGPSATDIGEKVTAKAWVVLDAYLDAETVTAGSDYTIVIKDKYVKGEETGDLTIPMADLDVDLSAEEGTIAPATVTVSNSLGEATYTAPDAADDAITIKAYSNTLKTIVVEDIESAPAPVYDYETTPSPAVVDDYAGGDQMVTVTVSCDVYTEYIQNAKMKVYINGATTGKTITTTLYRDATGKESFTFNLKQFASDLTQQSNTLIFMPDQMDWESYIETTNYNPLTVNVAGISEPIETSIAAEDLEMGYKDGSAWAVTLTDADGNPISDAVVKIGIDVNGVGKVYNRVTDANGVASLPINIAPGQYAVNATFDGDDTYAGSFAEATVTVTPGTTILSGENLVMGYKDGSAWAVTLTDALGSAISNVIVKMGITVNGVEKVYSLKTDTSGVASLAINLGLGEYAVSATFEGTSKYAAAYVNATVTVNKAALTISAEDLTMGYKDGSSYKVNVTDANGNSMANVNVKFTIGTKSYNFKTDSNGVAELPINLPLGDYTITATVNDALYESDEITNAISVTTDGFSIVADDVNMTYKDGTAYEVQLVNGEGNPVALANQVVKITISGKSYNMKTNANGIASLPINLKAGNYVITAEYNGIEISNNITVVNA